MAEGGEVSLSSGLEYDFFCEVCVDDGKHLEAHGYCENCEEYLCEECCKAHTRPRSTRHNVLKDKNNMPNDKSMSTVRLNKTIVTKCKYHSDKLVEIYCNSHEVFGCNTCLAKTHKYCQKVEYIQEISEHIFESEDMKKFTSRLTSVADKAYQMMRLSSRNTASARKCSSDFVAAVRQTKEKFIKILNENEDTMVTLPSMLCSDVEKGMQITEKECNESFESIEEIRSEIEQLQSSKRACQLYIKMRETASEINTHEENLKITEHNNDVKMYCFEPNKDMAIVLRNPNALGKLFNDNFLTNPIVPKVSDIDVSSGSDKTTCFITGSVVLPYSRVVLVDHNNSKIKLLNTIDNNLLRELELPSAPWDITEVANSKVAVTLPDSGNVLFLDVQGMTFKKERQIDVGKHCYGIAYYQDRLILSYTCGSDDRVDMLDLNSRVIGTIRRTGLNCLLYVYDAIPMHLCVSNDGNTIYVSDRDHNKVTGLSMQGDTKFVYEDKELAGAHGVCTDNEGNVYVCGSYSKNVHMITADCKKVKVILTQPYGPDSGDKEVTSVSHCRDTNRLFIGIGRNIKIFQLF